MARGKTDMLNKINNFGIPKSFFSVRNGKWSIKRLIQGVKMGSRKILLSLPMRSTNKN